MVIYQPNKPELLINTAWGTAYKDLDKEAAKAQKLIIWNDRWVSQETYEQLQREHRVYSWIHLTALFTTLGGIVGTAKGLGMAFTATDPVMKVGGGIDACFGIAALVVAYLLRRYHPLGRTGAVWLGCLHVATALFLFFERGMTTVPILALVWQGVWLTVIWRLFYNPVGRIIFAPNSPAKAAEEPDAPQATHAG